MPLAMRTRLLSPSPVVATIACALFASAPARADDKAACVAASDQAQTLRDDGKYRAARAALAECSRDACPGIVRRDCEKWLLDLDASQPTVVFGARDPKGNDVDGTRVLVDGTLLVEHLDGKPVAVDPGEHVFRYEASGVAPVEQRVVVRVNEKNRTLTAILMPQATPAVVPGATTPAASSSSSSASPREGEASGGGVPAATWVFLGLTAVAGGSFAYFGISGQNDVSNMRAPASAGGCAPNCAQSQVDSARTKLNVADVSLGVGVVSLALAAVFYFRRDREPAHPAAAMVDVEPRPGGGFATVSARF
jgi:hypothetical protein